ncbi:MAG: calcium/sodium antiporter [Roseburia sp.]|nr:calcium/sodium antiporter [Roseburia sp.]
MEIALQFLLLAVGFILLMKGADWFVDGASKVADRFGIPHIVIGLTIVAFGTSAPEAAISISAAIKGSVDLAISNVLGSNIMNVLLILGLASIICPLAVKPSSIRFDIPFTFVVSVMPLACGALGGRLTRVDGVIFWALLIIDVVYMIRLTRKSQIETQKNGQEDSEKDKVWKSLVLILLGAAMIIVGSDVTVDAATAIAQAFGMGERLIGLTIVAFGTSLPELVTSCIAAKKRETDIAVGNIVGSNLFNILFVLGTTAVITPIAYTSAFIVDNLVAIAVMLLLWLLVFRSKKLSRANGILFLALYAAYFANLMVNA